MTDIELLQKARDMGFFVKATATDMAANHFASCLNAAMHLSAGVLLMAATWFGAQQCVPKPATPHLATRGRVTDTFFRINF